MDRRERIEDVQTALLAALQGNQADIWTALPGIIQSFDPVAQTCQIQPSIRAKVTNVNGTVQWIDLPILSDCPVYFPSGGEVVLTFPVVKGDEALVVFSSRCIDAWWQNGGIQNQVITRMHDLSDGMVYVGFNSVPQVPSNISTTAAQLRSKDGAAYIELNPSDHKVKVITSSDIVATAGGDITANATTVTVNAPTVTVNADNASVNATTSATITAPAITLKNAGAALKKLVNDTFITLYNNHVHTNGNGGANTGTPTVIAGSSTATSTLQAE